MKTHLVLDLVYTKEEGQEIYSGTLTECDDFVLKQGGATFMYKVVPMTTEEFKIYNL